MNLTKRLLLSMFLSLSFCAISFAQTVSGTVTGADSEPLIGATILVQGTDAGASTDIDGMYSITANTGDIFEISYVGYRTQTFTVTGTTMDINLEEDATTLNDVVVSATRRPVRKLQATTAISSVSATQLRTTKPESFSEAIENTPGVTVNNAQGRKAVFNIRGFPTGNGYVTTLIDGLPTSGSGTLAGSSSEFFGFDPNIERIEVVRGAAATLFGRSSGAGAVNIISKTGGEETHGSVSFTKYSNNADDGHQFEGDFDFRADWNINGAMSEKLRYNIGGYFLNDSGTKEQFAKDKGSQIRTNIDWLISKDSKIRFNASFMNNEFQNITDALWNPTTNSVPEGFTGASTLFWENSQLDLMAATPDLDANTGLPIPVNPSDFGEKVVGGSVGFDADIALGGDWFLNQKFRYQKFDWNDINAFGFTGFMADTGGSSFRFNSGAFQNVTDVLSETRISKVIKGANVVHNLNAGLYYGDGERDRLSFSYTFLASADPRAVYRGFGPTLSSNASISGTSSHREEKTTGLFIGDEMVINNKLSINVALRYDVLNASFSNDPDNIRNINVDLVRDMPASIGGKYDDWSGSIGFNYLTGENSAIYGNALRAFALPAITSLAAPSEDDPNEIIQNLEIGYRAGLGDLTLDIGVFNTKIDNRTALFFEAGVNAFIPQPAGSNKILGAEIDLTYAPSAIKGLLIRGAYTAQQSEYTEFLVQLSTNRTTGAVNADLNNLFGLTTVGTGDNIAIDVEGKQVQRTPRGIMNLNIGYNSDRWGADFGGFTYTGINPDIFNLYEQPNLSIYNFGAYVKFPMQDNELRISMRIKNVFGAENPQELLLSSGNDSSLLERQAHPTGANRLYWATIQNPRRLLLTASYSF